jgi:hypothetical protein
LGERISISRHRQALTLYAICSKTMTYEEFTRQFKNQTEVVSYDRQIDLAIAICTQLFFEYEKFSNENSWGDPDLVLDTITFIDKFKGFNLDHEVLTEKTIQIEAITPDTEDFDNASYALNCCVAILETLDFMKDHTPNRIYEVGTCLTDTVYLKIQEKLTLDQDDIDRNPEMIAARRYLLEMTR